jgi:hypothetical protein
MSFTRLSVFIAALALLSFAGPAHANSLHTEKGASGQGLIADANFTSVTRTVDGVTIGQFDDQTTLYDVFTIPSSFETGTPFVLTFADITQGYGIFDCDNGTNNFALSADSPAVALVGPCTTGPLGSNDVFVNFVESGNTATISFLGGAGAPSAFVFYTTAENLTGIEPTSSSSNVPEPSSMLLLASGLAGLMLLRRRAEA